jgi:hypothetical protein
VFVASVLVNYFKAHARRVFAELHGADPTGSLVAVFNEFLEERDGKWQGTATELFDGLSERRSEGLPGSPSKLAVTVLAIADRSQVLDAKRGWRDKSRILRLQLLKKGVGGVGSVGKKPPPTNSTNTTNTSFEDYSEKMPMITRQPSGTPPLSASDEWEEVLTDVWAGELRAIAVLGEGRSEELPNVPTAKELGYDVSVPVWGAIAAPAETPPQVVEELGRAFVDVSSSRVFRTALRGTGREPTQRGGEGFAEYVEEQSRLLPKDGPEPEVDE